MSSNRDKRRHVIAKSGQPQRGNPPLDNATLFSPSPICDLRYARANLVDGCHGPETNGPTMSCVLEHWL